MKRVFGLSTMLLAAVLAHAADPQTLPNWGPLPSALQDHKLTFVAYDGVSFKAELKENQPRAFSVDVKSTTDAQRYPKGNQIIAHDEIAEVRGSIWKFSFDDFACSAFGPLAYSLPVFLVEELAAKQGFASADDHIALAFLTPVSLAWAAGGLAIAPIVAPIGYLRGRRHYDFRVPSNHGEEDVLSRVVPAPPSACGVP
jgi:hypothetical protein